MSDQKDVKDQAKPAPAAPLSEDIRHRLWIALVRACVGADNTNYALGGLSIEEGRQLLAELDRLRAENATLRQFLVLNDISVEYDQWKEAQK